MLPIRVASIALRSGLVGLLLLLLLSGAFLGFGEAAPLKGPGVDTFRALVDSKNDPTPSRKAAPAELAVYRGKMRKAVKELPSLGEVARVLLLSEWNLIDYGTESPELLKQAGAAVRAESDDAFRSAIEKLTATTAETVDIERAVIAEIKREARLQLLERLETRTRFYLLEGRMEDRIAASNLLSDTMIESRRQDRHEMLTSAGMIRESGRRESAPSSRKLRQRLASLGNDLRKLVADSNPQVQVAAIRALSDLEIPPEDLVAALKPKLMSKDTPVIVRRAVAEALGHVMSRVLEVLTNLLDESRPLPRVKLVEHVLPVAVLGLSDSDVRVRGSSLVACERAARILDELTRNQQMPPERLRVFQPILQIVTEAMPKINDAARDSVPALRVSACRVLETFALSSLRLRKYNESRPPSTLPEPSKPSTPLPKEDNPIDKEVSLPTIRNGHRSSHVRPSQWAATRDDKRVAILLPPMPFVRETPTPAVTLERPIKLAPMPVPLSESRVPSPNKHSELKRNLVRPASFVAQRLDDLPAPTPIPGFWNLTVQTMMKNLSDPDYRVRLGAVDVLETLGDRAEAAIPALVKALRDSNKFVRWGSARTLGRLAPRQSEEVVPGLVALLNDREDIGVRQAVLHALEEYGEHAKQAVPHLARVINRGDKDYILAVLHTIQSIGTEAAPVLPNVAWLLSDRSQPASVRVEAANTLGRFGELGRKQPRVLPILRDVMLHDPDEAVRGAASSAVLAIDRPSN